MNILIPHKWLLEHLETQADPKTIQEKLSLCGPSVERIYDIEGDQVYDIEVTTNRVDSMSVRGIAREAAVILTNFGIKSQLKADNEDKMNVSELSSRAESRDLPLPKINNDPNLSKRVICVILKDVQRTPTPDWMATRLEQTEMNVHDSAIDITNYITHELGHPCHAFDYDKLMNTGGEINVVEAKPGETFATLDGEEFETVGGEVVFKNGQGQIIDLPSIKGTANTSIDNNTQNVLLLLESIRADKVRFASMTHAIRTTAAQLMEKDVDPHLAKDVLLRGIELYQDLCHASVASPIYDDFPGEKELPPVQLGFQLIDNYLGLTLDHQKIEQILVQLGCRVESDHQSLTVYPPSFRPDINIPADVVEEIARIYGYHNLPSKVMDTQIPLKDQPGVDFALENKIKHFLSDIGWQEVYTYSMVSQELAEQSGYGLDEHLKLANPLTDDKVYLRRSLIPSLVEVIKQNPLEEQMSVFEIANSYLPVQDQAPEHLLHLTLVSSNDYRHIIGDLQALMAKLFIYDFKIDQNQTDQAHITANKVEIGTIVVLKNKIFAIDIDFASLIKVAHKHPKYHPIAKSAPIFEDMTFTLDEDVRVGDLIEQIKTVDNLLKEIELTDIYKRNHTFRFTYQDQNTNLSVADIEPIRKKIVELLESNYSAKLVGEI